MSEKNEKKAQERDGHDRGFMNAMMHWLIPAPSENADNPLGSSSPRPR